MKQECFGGLLGQAVQKVNNQCLLLNKWQEVFNMCPLCDLKAKCMTSKLNVYTHTRSLCSKDLGGQG